MQELGGGVQLDGGGGVTLELGGGMVDGWEMLELGGALAGLELVVADVGGWVT